MGRTRQAVDRFWSKVDRSGGPAACWPWLGWRDRDGYGRTKVGGVRVLTHRFAFSTRHGLPASDVLVMHRCDTPACCNPAHLRTGTQQDNIADRHAKRRDAIGDRNGLRVHPESVLRGEANPCHVLTEADVISMRDMLDAGASLSQAARRFGVSKKLAINIKHRRAWKHVA